MYSQLVSIVKQTLMVRSGRRKIACSLFHWTIQAVKFVFMFLASFYSIHVLQCKQISCIVLKKSDVLLWSWKLNSPLIFFLLGSCEESLNVCSQGGSWDLERADQGTGREEQQAGTWEQPAEEPGKPRAAAEVSVTAALRVQPPPGASGAGLLRGWRAPVQQHGICCISGSAMGRAEPQLSPEMGPPNMQLQDEAGCTDENLNLKWKHCDKWPSSVISDNLFGLTLKRESNVDVWGYCTTGLTCPLLGRVPSLAIPWSLSRRDGEGFARWSWPRAHLWPIQVKPRKCICPCGTPPQPQAIWDSRSCPPCHWSLVLWTFLSSYG